MGKPRVTKGRLGVNYLDNEGKTQVILWVTKGNIRGLPDAELFGLSQIF